MPRLPPTSTLFPYTTLFRSVYVPHREPAPAPSASQGCRRPTLRLWTGRVSPAPRVSPPRSEEHTSELQSLTNLVCRLLLEKKKQHKNLLHFDQRKRQSHRVI